MTDNLLERLCHLVNPPEVPECNDGNWGDVESALGLTLPEEYKRLIHTFGHGVFVGKARYSGLYILSYLGPANPVQRAKGFTDYFRSLDAKHDNMHPASHKLLGLGSFGDKDTLAWNALGPPEKWPIVYHAPETGIHEVNDMTLFDFIISILEESSPLHKRGVIDMGHMKGPHTFIPGS